MAQIAQRGACCQCQSTQLVVPNSEKNPFPDKDPTGSWVMAPHVIPGTSTMCDGEGTCPQALVK